MIASDMRHISVSKRAPIDCGIARISRLTLLALISFSFEFSRGMIGSSYASMSGSTSIIFIFSTIASAFTLLPAKYGRGISPNRISVTSLKSRDLSDVKMMPFSDIPQPYMQNLRNFASAGNIIKAEAILEQMKMIDLEPNLETYELLINTWINSKESDIYTVIYEVSRYFSIILSHGYRPSDEVLVKFIDYARIHRKPQAAIKLVEALEKLDILGSIDVYNAYLHLWSQISQARALNQTSMIYASIIRANLSPKPMTYELLLTSWCQNRDDTAQTAKPYNDRLVAGGRDTTSAAWNPSLVSSQQS